MVFKVQRNNPELLAPSKPTHREFKPLSDIDDQDGLRFQIPVILFFRHSPEMKGKDPVKVIRDAIREALSYYQPFAGRLRETHERKLVVDCTGEGILFVAADADVTLEEFGHDLQPPFPNFDELLHDVPGSSGVTDCPLLVIQVTRLRCGGFIFALRLNHTMCDAPGLVQFMTAVAEIARGLKTPSVLPVWSRHVLNARSPPSVTCTHREYDEVADTKGTLVPLDDMSHKSFLFGPDEIKRLRQHAPKHLRNCTTFELLTACLWKCRTVAIEADPDEEVRMICIVNARKNLALPTGYYGNAFAFPVAVATAGELNSRPLGYALDLVRKAKNSVDEEYMKSLVDLLVSRGRPHFTAVRSYLVSDVTHAGFAEVDFGWGRPAYGGPARGGVGAIPGVASFLIPFSNKEGKKGIVLPICLPGAAMDRFVKELNMMLADSSPSPLPIMSAL